MFYLLRRLWRRNHPHPVVFIHRSDVNRPLPLTIRYLTNGSTLYRGGSTINVELLPTIGSSPSLTGSPEYNSSTVTATTLTSYILCPVAFLAGPGIVWYRSFHSYRWSRFGVLRGSPADKPRDPRSLVIRSNIVKHAS